MAGATLHIPELARSVLSNREGLFRFEKLPAGTYTLIANRDGFEEHSRPIDLKGENTELVVEIELNRGILEMDEVVVTGVLTPHKLKNTPVITEVVRQEEIRDIGAATLSDVLAEQTGLEIRSGLGRTQAARVHGLKDNHVLILVDGQRISGEVNGALDLGQIPLEQVEKIETVKGPLSSMYGSDALGGVINIITRRAEDTPLLTLGAGVGTYGRQDYSLSAGKQFNNILGERKDIAVALSGSWILYDGIDYRAADNISEVPGYNRKDMSLRTRYKAANDLSIGLRAALYSDKSDWLEGDADNVIRNEATNDKFTLVGEAGWQIGAIDNMRFTANVSRNKHGLATYFKRVGLDRNFSKRPGGDLSTETLFDASVQYITDIFDHGLLMFGGQHSRERIESNRLAGNQAETFSNIAFAESEWHQGSFTYMLGARFSNNSEYGAFLAPRASLMVQASEQLKLRFSYGRGYSEPTLKDLYIDYANATVGYRVEGAPALQPEKSHGFNTGVEYSPAAGVWLRINAYYNQVTELIEFYQKSAEGEPLVFSYRNVEEARTAGVELDVTWSIIKQLSLKLGYAFTSAVDGAGNTLDFTIPHTFNFKLSYTYAEWGLRTSLYGRWLDEQPVTNIQSDAGNVGDPDYYRTPSHGMLNMNVQKSLLDALSLSAGVTNITDVTQYPFGQLKKREFYLGARYTIP